MAKGGEEVIDSQIISENVEFLDCGNGFDVSTDCNALKLVTELYAEEERHITQKNRPKKQRRGLHLSENKTLAVEATLCGDSKVSLAVLKDVKNKKLKAWGLPDVILQKYESRGIKEMFEWQVSCLGNSKVLLECCNLVYSAPTSAGKTLVAEILTIKTLLERQKKVVIILPFVSIVREKTFYLQDILSSSGIRVEGFMGSQSPPGGLQAVHVAICTIEKANSLINKLLEEGTIQELGAVIVDEMHLLGDPHRGYILELLLTKIMYVSSKYENVQIQIVGMSATLPNLEVLAKWLKAELFITNFRPIPLDEYCLVGKQYYNREGICVAKIEDSDLDMLGNDSVLKICFDTIKEGCSALIFCMTKNRCESLAQNIASSFYRLGCSGTVLGSVLREQLKSDAILEVLEQLKSCPVGLDKVLKNTISFGVAYHHAGLTFDERDIIEGSFKSGAIRVLVATSTLSSGVNLPARRVIIRTPVFLRQPINILTYKQMIGRAGRMGKDVKGESILVCTDAELNIGMNLMMGALEPVTSCIEDDDKFMRAILEIIASEVACTNKELELYAQSTLLFNQKEISETLLTTTLQKLVHFELVRLQDADECRRYVATSLGKACLSSSMAPNDGLSLFFELQKARECIVLETDLHLIYLVTPYSVSSQWADLDWLHLLTMYQNMSKAMRRVANLVGVEESFIIHRMKNNKCNAVLVRNKITVHKRFYTALALQDLVNEMPLAEVATKFQCARGFLQSLQQAAATFAGMVTVFCHQLGWKNMEMLVAQFQDRLHFGIHSELIELMKLPSLNGIRARTLFSAGFETIANVAAADCSDVENALVKALPFQSEKQRDSEDDVEVRKRNKMKNVWITGHCGMTTKQAAENLILEARRYLKLELGVTDIKWDEIDNHNPVASKEIKAGYQDNVPEIKAETEQDGNVLIENADCSLSSKDEHHQQENIQSPLKLFIENNVNPEVPTPKLSTKESFKIKPHKYLSDNIIEEENQTVLQVEKEYSRCEIEWDSLNFTEVALSNVIKNRVSDIIFSPQLCFNESDIKIDDNSTPKSTSIQISKDVSLFSADGTDNSLFEDSLPIDQIPSKLLNDPSEESKTTNTDEVEQLFTLNTDSIANAFTSEIIIEDDEDIRLVYEDDENKISDVLESQCINNIQENARDLREIVENTVAFSSPYKHKPSGENSANHPSRKKRKLKNGNLDRLTLSNVTKPNDLPRPMSPNVIKLHDVTASGSFTWDEKIMSYYVIQENDIILLDQINTASVCFEGKRNNNNINGNKIIIGSYICPTKTQSSNKSDESISMAIYCGFGCVLVLNTMWKALPQWLAKVNLRVASSKDTYLALKRQYGLEITSCFDVVLAQWFINTDEKENTLDTLIRSYSISSNTRNRSNLQNCIAIWEIAEKQQRLLQMKPCSQITLDMEHQVSVILAQTEYHGITVDKNLASKMLGTFKKYRETIEAKLYETYGHRFNIRSSVDVAKLLGIDKSRRVSTKKSILIGLGPVAHMVMLWRKLDAILTKTLYPLTEQAVIYSKGNKINPSYKMFTCTGRMSMHEPNLQSVPRTFHIPMEYISRDPTSKAMDPIECNCRNIFKASPGYVLVSADYCQLEMRILTHYCKDQVLTQIMRSPHVDVFKSIAASWCNISEEEVDDDLRQKAKQLCYGIIYGMGTKSLSLSLDITAAEASVLMYSFHGTYPAIAQFKSDVIGKCLEVGYVETLMKRRRCLPDIRLNANGGTGTRRGVLQLPTLKACADDVLSPGYFFVAHKGLSTPYIQRETGLDQSTGEFIIMIREDEERKKTQFPAQAERQAVNTTIQGSAADIAKAAMCAIDSSMKRLPEDGRARLILQMHDELIYEVPESTKSEFIHLLQQAMENTVKLNVPLPVKVKIGPSWGSLKEITVIEEKR